MMLDKELVVSAEICTKAALVNGDKPDPSAASNPAVSPEPALRRGGVLPTTVIESTLNPLTKATKAALSLFN